MRGLLGPSEHFASVRPSLGFASPRCRSGYFDRLTPDIWLKKGANCSVLASKGWIFMREWTKRAFGWGKTANEPAQPGAGS